MGVDGGEERSDDGDNDDCDDDDDDDGDVRSEDEDPLCSLWVMPRCLNTCVSSWSIKDLNVSSSM